MTFSFTTLGCKLNFAESSALAKALMERGHTRAKQGEQADICVINTCTVTDTADHKDRQIIHRIRRQNPNAILIVTGCYAQLKPEEIAHIDGVDYVLGQNEKFRLAEFVHSLESRVERGESRDNIFISPIREVEDFHGAFSRDDRTRCFLKVQDGCNYFCSYCTIPLARGKSRNPSIAPKRKEDSIVPEVYVAIYRGKKALHSVTISHGKTISEHTIGGAA